MEEPALCGSEWIISQPVGWIKHHHHVLTRHIGNHQPFLQNTPTSLTSGDKFQQTTLKNDVLFSFSVSLFQNPIKCTLSPLPLSDPTVCSARLVVPGFPPLISPGINHTLPVPRGERDESGGELEIMLMSRRVSPPLWPFQKLLILLVVSGLEIITSSNPCNTA